VIFLISVVLLLIPEIYLYPMFLVVIKPSGESKIGEIIAQVSKINDTYGKLEKIAEWESKNFTNTYGRKIDIRLLWGYPIYFDSGIKVRASYPQIPELSNNPQWIAYFKVGGCGELAYLFDEVARRAGIDARIVTTYGEDHTWNEVRIDDKWISADPTIYSIYNIDQNNSWFDNPKFYESKPWFNISKVFVIGTQEDITYGYTNTGALQISFTRPTDRVIIRTMKNGMNRDVYLVNVNSSELEIELGGKNYIVIAEKDVVPYLAVLRDTKDIEVVEGERTTVQLSPREFSSETMRLFQILVWYIVLIIAILILAGATERPLFDKKRKRNLR